MLTGVVCTHVLFWWGGGFAGAPEWLQVTHSMNY